MKAGLRLIADDRDVAVQRPLSTLSRHSHKSRKAVIQQNGKFNAKASNGLEVLINGRSELYTHHTSTRRHRRFHLSCQFFGGTNHIPSKWRCPHI